ncbi:hypothetical protein ACFLSJ_03180 [Verrucomicrobiota bacterium]
MHKIGQYLVVRSGQTENTYGAFTREILLSEGFMGFETVDLDRQSMPDLRPDELVLLTRCFLDRAQLESLLARVADGVALVVLQPQHGILDRLGIKRRKGLVLPACVRVGAGKVASGLPLQTHLPMNHWSLPGDAHPWHVIARAVDSEWNDVAAPAVASSQIGKGSIACFFYDPAEAVARIRFGNPDLASFSTLEDWAWPHVADMYADHVDPRAKHLPQGDLHAQLLARVLEDVSPVPLARFWYYPEAEQRSICIFQSDGDGSTPEQFQSLASALERRNGTATFYLMESTKLTPGHVNELRLRGHTFAPHVNPTNRTDELYFAIPDALREETVRFKERFGACSTSLQCHCAPWMGYMELLPAHIRNGYRLLFASLSLPLDMWGHYMCGSGRPMKYFDREGVLHDCWQQPVTIYDDTTLTDKLTNHLEDACGEFERLLQESTNESHTPLALLSHPVSFCTYSSRFFERALSRVHEEGIPIWNGDEWTGFIDRRAAAQLEQVRNDDGTASYVVTGLKGQLPLMIPVSQSSPSGFLVNRRPAEHTAVERFGRRRAVISLDETMGEKIEVKEA